MTYYTGPDARALNARTLTHREKRLQRTAPAVVHAQMMHDGQFPARQCSAWCAWNERAAARDHAARALIRASWRDYWLHAARLATHHVMR